MTSMEVNTSDIIIYNLRRKMASLVEENQQECMCNNYSDHNISNNGQHVYNHCHSSRQHVQHDELFLDSEVATFCVCEKQIRQKNLTAKNGNNNRNDDSLTPNVKESTEITTDNADETKANLVGYEDTDNVEIIIFVEKGYGEIHVGVVSKLFVPSKNQMILASTFKFALDTKDEHHSKNHDIETEPRSKEVNITTKTIENMTSTKKGNASEAKHVHFQRQRRVSLRSHKMEKDSNNQVYQGVENVEKCSENPVCKDYLKNVNMPTVSNKVDNKIDEEPASKPVLQNMQKPSSHVSSSESDLRKYPDRGNARRADKWQRQLPADKKITILQRGCDISTAHEKSYIIKDRDSKGNKNDSFSKFPKLKTEINQNQPERGSKNLRNTPVQISSSNINTTSSSVNNESRARRSKSSIDADGARQLEEKKEKERQRKKLARRKQRKYKHRTPKTELEIFQQQIETGQLRSMFSRYKTEGLKCLVMQKLLHKGTFSNKYKASFKNKQVVLTVYNEELADVINALDMAHMGNSYFVLGFSDCMTGPYGKLWFMSIFHSFGDLQKLLSRDRNRHVIGELHAQFITAGVLIGVDFLHQHEIVHGNIKPSKVLINALGYPVLTGFVKMTDKSDMEGNEAYTPAYVAPEHLRGNRDTAIDIFSVGCMAYEIITGWTPFDGETREQTLQNIQRACRPIYDPELFSFAGEFFIDSCLRRNPKERFWIGVERSNLIYEEWFSTLDWRDFRRQTLRSPILEAQRLINNRAELGWEEKAVQFKWGQVMDVMCPYTPSLYTDEDNII
ncbi:uncharacterized protein LOC123551660 isoform X2 [Mercenaria mercenaria]|uniref:uncharacterized protein LOC123551660 isoform X2 n=1 Tax=Mercenaria mercenaria TaxID=6596 RepID=UPI00234EA9BB|nr:uncharacterized protein LOC123551660 isoform X2 [Mercenaria mercenaria]